MTIHFKNLRKRPQYIAEAFWLRSSKFIYNAYMSFLETNQDLSTSELEDPYIEIRFKKRYKDKYDGKPNKSDNMDVIINKSDELKIPIISKVSIVKTWRVKPKINEDGPDANGGKSSPFNDLDESKFNQLKHLQPDLFEVGETFKEEVIAVTESFHEELPIRMVIMDDTIKDDNNKLDELAEIIRCARSELITLKNDNKKLLQMNLLNKAMLSETQMILDESMACDSKLNFTISLTDAFNELLQNEREKQHDQLLLLMQRYKYDCDSCNILLNMNVRLETIFDKFSNLMVIIDDLT